MRSCREMVSKRTIMWRGKVRSGESVGKTKRGKEREEVYSSQIGMKSNEDRCLLDENREDVSPLLTFMI